MRGQLGLRFSIQNLRGT